MCPTTITIWYIFIFSDRSLLANCGYSSLINYSMTPYTNICIYRKYGDDISLPLFVSILRFWTIHCQFVAIVLQFLQKQSVVPLSLKYFNSMWHWYLQMSLLTSHYRLSVETATYISLSDCPNPNARFPTLFVKSIEYISITFIFLLVIYINISLIVSSLAVIFFLESVLWLVNYYYILIR